jgi:agmatinase
MRNFGGVETRSGGDPARADVVIVPAPFEGSVSYGGGTARGPEAILEASLQVETRDDETGVRLEDLSFALAPSVEPAGPDPETYVVAMEEAVRPIVRRGAVPLVLGGEHSVTIGAVRAARAEHGKVHLLSLDAHADLRDSYEGSGHSHACVVRRLLEGGRATVVGVRSYSAEEAAFAADNRNVALVSAREAMAPGFRAAELVASLGEKVWVTFDVDGLDPSIVPATGTPEPGGLGWWVALDLLREVFARRTVVGLDVVELAPIAGSHVSDFTAARLVAKMLSYRETGAG